MSSLWQKGQKCTNTEKASRPLKLSHAGCRSLEKFQPRYCGSCLDGRCCRPHRTQTSPVQFRCRNGEIISRMVMSIESCKCDLNCSEKTTPRHRLFHDIHKLKKFWRGKEKCALWGYRHLYDGFLELYCSWFCFITLELHGLLHFEAVSFFFIKYVVKILIFLV